MGDCARQYSSNPPLGENKGCKRENHNLYQWLLNTGVYHNESHNYIYKSLPVNYRSGGLLIIQTSGDPSGLNQITKESI